MPEERRRLHDRRRTLDGAILEELRGRYGVDTAAFLTLALRHEQRVWEHIAGRGGAFRPYLPALLSRGLIASPSVTVELVRLVELGVDDRALKQSALALARGAFEVE